MNYFVWTGSVLQSIKKRGPRGNLGEKQKKHPNGKDVVYVMNDHLESWSQYVETWLQKNAKKTIVLSPETTSGPVITNTLPKQTVTQVLTTPTKTLVVKRTIQSQSPPVLLLTTNNDKPPVMPIMDLAGVKKGTEITVLMHILSFLPEKDVMNVRGVSKQLAKIGQRVLNITTIKFSGYTSEAFYLDRVIGNKIKESSKALISVDQITQVKLLRELTGNTTTIVNMGRDNFVPRDFSPMHIDLSDIGAKMHNKFFVLDDDRVITGSPNLSHNAFNENMETIVEIRSRQVVAYFKHYFYMMRKGWNPGGFKAMQDGINMFNACGATVRLALSPFISIQKFIEAELDGATTVVIRMFLVSYFEDGGDIVESLRDLADKGTKIVFVVDWEQYSTLGYVRKALGYLAGKNVRIYKQKKSSGAIMHEKLLLVTMPNGTHKTIIGSAGFSQNVMNNKNYENMVSIDGQALHDQFMQHHVMTMKSDDYVTAEVG